MFAPLPTPHEMAGWDRLCVDDFGILPIILMENASRAALQSLSDALTTRSQTLASQHVLLLAGPGNNGGDSIALSRHLHDLGCEVLLLHTKPRHDYKNEAAYHLELALKAGVPTRLATDLDARDLGGYDVVVDGLLGTGLSGELRPDMLNLVRLTNDLGRKAFVLALDIPSGLSGFTGHPLPEAVRADLTVTFEAAKIGIAQPEAAPYIGRLDVRPIGIPRALRKVHAPAHVLMTAGLTDLIEKPGPGLHKGTAGHVLIIGGSAGLTGAPMLAAVAAMRAGAGLATIACPAGIADAVKASRPEVMILPLGSGTEWTPNMMAALEPEVARFDAAVVGPGLGRAGDSANFLRAWLTTATLPTVYDADALNLLASQKELLKKIGESAIVTPHPGEMARLLDLDIAEVQARRSECCRRLAEKTGSVSVLKGAASLVAKANNPVAVSPYCEPNLAVAGSGDVLSGILGRLLAGGLDAYHAACLGVLWHGQAGSILARDFPYRGNMPLEIAHVLPQAIKELKGHVQR
ncbi:MAG: NAD(P)H-hydrate dehydratase [Desulfocurvibacter africanus]